jgi:hypothetical protein
VALASFALIPVAIGFAVLKYRLYDIDVVIRKAVVLGAIAVFFTVVYVAIVGGIGALVQSRSTTALSFVAAAVVALLFQPVLRRAQRIADRVVYGDRATPYEVLSEFSDRLRRDVRGRRRPASDGADRRRRSRRGARGRVAPRRRPAPRRRLVAVRRRAIGSGGLVGRGPSCPSPRRRGVPRRQRGDLLGALAVAMPPTIRWTTRNASSCPTSPDRPGSCSATFG